MKKYILILGMTISSILILLSCEDILETDYPMDQLSTEQVFEDANTAYSALNNLYTELRNQSFFAGTDMGMGILLGIYSDELDCFYFDQNGYRDVYFNQVQPTNSIVLSTWTAAYKQIYAANAIVQGVENSISLNQTDKNQIKGEAIFIRSLIYFYLQQVFGEIPYTTSLDYEYNRSLQKSEESQLLDQLTLDLTESISLLNDDYRQPERIYINRKVAEILLAKIYLTLGNYSNAETVVNSILQSPLYSFQHDIDEVFHNNSNHILWQLYPMVSSFPTWEAIFFYFEDAPHSFALSSDLINSFDNIDLRKTHWIKSVTVGEQTWYRPFKYKNNDENFNEYSVVFRLEEVYFIMAEALFKQNRISEAVAYINPTRIRAGLEPLTNLSYEEFANELANEKRKEFFTEFGHRFVDLKRWNQLNVLTLIKPNWLTYKKVWPIPLSELVLNPNLNPQNEGY